MKFGLLVAVLLALAAPASATAPRILPSQDLDPVWSPDRAQIAFTRVMSNSESLEVVNVRTGRVAQFATNTYQLQPSWSPDGRMIAYQARGAIWTGTVEAFRSFNPTRRTGRGQRAFAPRWNPNPKDEETIAYLTTFGARNTDLWLMVFAADGIERSLVARGVVGVPAWDPAGRRLAFQRDDGIDVVDPDVGMERRIATIANPGPPSFSHDGTRVAYVAENRVWVAAADGTSAPIAVSPRFTGIGTPSWSQRDDALVYLRAGGLEQTTIGGASRLLVRFALGFGGLASFRPSSNDIAFAGPRPACPGHRAIRVLALERVATTVSGSCVVAGTARGDRIEGSIDAGDVILGRGGNDRVHANDGHTDRVDCGTGRDIVYADRSDRLRRCEVVHR